MAHDHTEVFGGVDTHKHTHVAAAVDTAGRLLGAESFPADAAGYSTLLTWLESHGPIARVGVEGTGSYGAGLARRLAAAGTEVVEVNRPNRQTRRRRGKTDIVDAEAAARAALSCEATAVPKAADGHVEAIRMLSVARRSAVKARTVAANQINSLIVTADEHLKDRLRGQRTAAVVDACARMPSGCTTDATSATAKLALGTLARRHQALSAEINHLDTELLNLCAQANPALLGTLGVGADTPPPRCWWPQATIPPGCAAKRPSPRSAGPAPSRRPQAPQCATDSTAAANRQANNALWRIAMTRLRVDERTIAYAQRRRAQGKTTREILRCLKRHIAREIYRLLTDPPKIPQGADLRRQRTRHGLTLNDTAQALNTHATRISELERGLRHNRDLAQRYQQHLAEIPT